MEGINYKENIYDLLGRAIESDRKYCKDWILRWDYQDRRAKRKVSYGEGLPDQFYEYAGPADLQSWVNWLLNAGLCNYLAKPELQSFEKLSSAFDFAVFKKAGFEVDVELYHQTLGIYNAQDYFLYNLIPSPVESDPPKILDFGAGYGRQSNLLHQLKPGAVYVAMDAIPKSYCLQHFYFVQTGNFRQDYVTEPRSFSLKGADGGIHHLPTWRWDLLPDNYFDKVLLVEVLQELNSKLVRELIKTIHRVLKPGGCIYIRDNSDHFRPSHKIDTRKLLSESGFFLEFEHYILHHHDLHGIPRIWRKNRPEVEESRKRKLQERAREILVDFDVMTGGKVKNLLKGKKNLQ